MIPRREVATWFDASPEEHAAIVDLIGEVKAQIDEELHPDGYNVGFNAGEAAGQTVMHLHVHVIPRYHRDVPDPTGGVRHVIPGKGNYRRRPDAGGAASPVALGGIADPFLAHLRPLFSQASRADVVAAFVQDSGLLVLEPDIADLVSRGGSVRFLTGDYLAISQVEALERLLAWGFIPPSAKETPDEDVVTAGCFEARVVETARLVPAGASFHPKSWIFESAESGVAWVGSSNVSLSALRTGVEWNLRTERQKDPEAWKRLQAGFEGLWARATKLTPEWIQAYGLRAAAGHQPLPPGEEEEPEPEGLPVPHRIQQEALDALAETRREGRGRALCVMATGLGKTWLSAMDVQAIWVERGRYPRLLFLAHRHEILDQAARVFARSARHCGESLRLTYYAGSASDLSGHLVFASTQKLARPRGLEALERESFDYVVVDEVHHAAADGYRGILARLDAGFVLGLTATPDRSDGVDIDSLFDDNRPYEAGVAEGIELGCLVPFRYWGLKDTVDYSQIPWRNRRFDPGVLGEAAATQARMERLWGAWNDHRATRSLVFCCSVRHAGFVSSWLEGRGVRSEVVTGETMATVRQGALDRLLAGETDAVCSVDVFNEGVDLPAVDRVVMLRPTESSVLFLQQLGRGLRAVEGKKDLTVIDFVGNHRVFLDRIRQLLSLAARPVDLRQFLSNPRALELPPGCSVEVQLEAMEILRFLLPRGENEVIRAYRDFREVRSRRPRAGELFRSGYLPSRLGGWFRFVEKEGDLEPDEVAAFTEAGDWLRDLEATAMEKSFKMVVLEVLLEADALGEGMDLGALARRSHDLIARSPELMRDIEGVARFSDPRHPDLGKWLAYWRENPVRAWTEGKHGRWFEVKGDRFLPREGAWRGLPSLPDLTRELVDYRLAQYRRRFQSTAGGTGFDCKVTWNQRDPILKLPDRARRPDTPSGETDVRLPDGAIWRFRFSSQFCNVARPVGKDRNELPDLMRRWFGPSAGKPGTNFHVAFVPYPDGLWTEPRGVPAISFSESDSVRSFPSLRAVAGPASLEPTSQEDAEDLESRVRLRLSRKREDVFTVRASGVSMDGGKEPIRDGDWMIMKWTRSLVAKDLVKRACLVEVSELDGSHAFQIKRVIREGGRWLLRSLNPAVPDIPAEGFQRPVASLVEVIRPEDLAPDVGTTITDAELAKAFGLTERLRNGRTEGHLFALVESPGSFPMPDRLSYPVRRFPGETVFVLARVSMDHPWRYCGVGRWLDDEGLWAIPDLDYETQRALGSGRNVSRRLAANFREEATAVVANVLRVSAEGDGWLPGHPARIHVAGRSAEGGLRIDGGPAGFAERTISLADIGWALAARDDVRENGGTLDEARANRLRYLEGTPKGSTRRIDTRYAIGLVEWLAPGAPSGQG